MFLRPCTSICSYIPRPMGILNTDTRTEGHIRTNAAKHFISCPLDFAHGNGPDHSLAASNRPDSLWSYQTKSRAD